MFDKYIRKAVKPAKKAREIVQAFKVREIDSLAKLDNLPIHGVKFFGLDTYQLVSQVREAYLLDQVKKAVTAQDNEEEE